MKQNTYTKINVAISLKLNHIKQGISNGYIILIKKHAYKKFGIIKTGKPYQNHHCESDYCNNKNTKCN